MKKIYIIPQVLVVNLQTSNLMQMSNPDTISTTNFDSNIGDDTENEYSSETGGVTDSKGDVWTIQ